MSVFRWTDGAKKAAELVAAGEYVITKVAEEVGVTRQTIHNWLNNPEFQQRVADHAEGFRAKVRSRGIAILEHRVDALNDRWMRMRRIIEARAVAYADDDHGGETGLIRRRVSGWKGKGDDKEPVYDYEFDGVLLKELREHEKQAAQELGQWTEKKEVSGEEGKPFIVKVIRGASMDDL